MKNAATHRRAIELKEPTNTTNEIHDNVLRADDSEPETQEAKQLKNLQRIKLLRKKRQKLFNNSDWVYSSYVKPDLYKINHEDKLMLIHKSRKHHFNRKRLNVRKMKLKKNLSVPNIPFISRKKSAPGKK